MKRISLLFLILNLTLVHTTYGMVGLDLSQAGHINNRELIQTSRGLAVANRFIADIPVTANYTCEQAKLDIQKKCSELEVKKILSTGVSISDTSTIQTFANNIEIVESCLIPFECDGIAVSGGELNAFEAQGITIENDFAVFAEATKSWGIDRIDQEKLPLDGKFSSEYDGSGVNIYIVDTGVLSNHNEFKGRYTHGGDFINEGTKNDKNGHGTHCAGTAAGSTYGIARGARVFGVKVLSGSGSGSTSGVISGIDWCVKNQKNKFNNEASVISMSLGGGKSNAMNKAATDAAKAGHIVTVAAGNSNHNACNDSPASAGGSGASKSGVITVVSSNRKDRRSSFSSYGSCTDIIAPGTDIVSAYIGNANAKATLSGTSMACPHVAGVGAVLLHKHGKNKKAAQDELFEIAIGGVITDTQSPDRVKFLQVNKYTGPPTRSPTPFPTNPPNMQPNVCAGDYCFMDEFKQSEFGASFPDKNSRISFPMAMLNEDKKNFGCRKFKKKYTNKIVLLYRGDCLFTTKVLNAQKAGAKGVIIMMSSSDAAFAPGWDGRSKKPNIISGLVSRSVANKIIAEVKQNPGAYLTFGKPRETLPPGTTAGPTPQPTRRRRRRRRRGLVGEEDEEDRELISKDILEEGRSSHVFI